MRDIGSQSGGEDWRRGKAEREAITLCTCIFLSHLRGRIKDLGGNERPLTIP